MKMENVSDSKEPYLKIWEDKEWFLAFFMKKELSIE